MCSSLNKLFVESKITEIGHQVQKLSLFFRVSSVLIGSSDVRTESSNVSKVSIQVLMCRKFQWVDKKFQCVGTSNFQKHGVLGFELVLDRMFRSIHWKF